MFITSGPIDVNKPVIIAGAATTAVLNVLILVNVSLIKPFSIACSQLFGLACSEP